MGALHDFVQSRNATDDMKSAIDHTPPPILAFETLRRALAGCEGVECITSLSAEADDEIVGLCRSGAVHAVLSTDSDFGVAKGCVWVPFEHMCIDADESRAASERCVRPDLVSSCSPEHCMSACFAVSG